MSINRIYGQVINDWDLITDMQFDRQVSRWVFLDLIYGLYILHDEDTHIVI